MSYTFRKITLDNEEDVKPVIKEAFAAEPWCDKWDNEAIFHQYIVDIMGNANSLSFGVFDGDKLIGLASGRLKHWFNGIEYNIDEVCISPSYQGMGIGSFLLTEVEKYGKENGFTLLSLLTYDHAPAYGFYLKNGFGEKEHRAFLLKEI